MCSSFLGRFRPSWAALAARIDVRRAGAHMTVDRVPEGVVLAAANIAGALRHVSETSAARQGAALGR